jgi:hypothetical protein
VSEFFLVEAGNVIQELDADTEQGLSSQVAAMRLEEFGLNEWVETGQKSP